MSASAVEWSQWLRPWKARWHMCMCVCVSSLCFYASIHSCVISVCGMVTALQVSQKLICDPSQWEDHKMSHSVKMRQVHLFLIVFLFLFCGWQFRAGGEAHKGPVVSAQEAQAQAILSQAKVSIDALCCAIPMHLYRLEDNFLKKNVS